MKVPQNHRIEMTLFSALEYLLSAFAGVVARVESLQLATLGDFVRGWMVLSNLGKVNVKLE